MSLFPRQCACAGSMAVKAEGSRVLLLAALLFGALILQLKMVNGKATHVVCFY